MATQAIKRNTRGRSLLLVALVVLAAVISFVSYAATSGGSSINISAPDTDNGTKADVSSVSTPFEGVQGQGKKTKGVVLAKLKFGTGINNFGTNIDMLWTDPGQAAGVLLNPNAFLETRLYFVDNTCPTEDQRTFVDVEVQESPIIVCPDNSGTVQNFTAMSIQGTYAHFISTTSDQNLLYVLADINVPGGAPAGQQSQLNSLTFNFVIN